VIAKKAPKKHEAFLVQMNPRVSQVFTGNAKRVLHALEEETGRRFHFTGSEGLPLDHFDIVMEGSREEVQERAVPFREGDEVLVHIVEPHMYDVDDAVAKIDGYIISVSGGGRFVGAKRLVRIEHAGRTSATATMLDAPEGDDADVDAEDEPGEDGVESAARRRGRRGGRRRSRATAESGATPASES
jgi:ribonuclease G